ncbi:MAG: hypothetical protein K0R76_1663 [Alphaproteobacteria bacterium]|nr:hypothetical protein [Alphaproteobacteria bacterium]
MGKSLILPMVRDLLLVRLKVYIHTRYPARHSFQLFICYKDPVRRKRSYIWRVIYKDCEAEGCGSLIETAQRAVGYKNSWQLAEKKGLGVLTHCNIFWSVRYGMRMPSKIIIRISLHKRNITRFFSPG